MECFILLDHHRFENLNRLIKPDYECPCAECLIYKGKQSDRLYAVFKSVCDWNRYGERVLKWMQRQNIECETKEIYRYYHTNNDSPKEFEDTVYKKDYRTNEDKAFIESLEKDMGLPEATSKIKHRRTK